MSTSAIFRDFRPPELFRNKYRRGQGIFEIWDANLHHGDVRPFACPEVLCDPGVKYKSLYPEIECECFGFTEDVDMVTGFCDNHRFYIKDGFLVQNTVENMCVGGDPIKAGTPYPRNAPSVGGGCSGCGAATYSYVVTYVSQYGNIQVEGSPSPASSPVAGNGSSPGLSVSWDGAPAGYSIVAVRVYRTEASYTDTGAVAEGSEFVLVAELGANATSFNDSVSVSETGGPLITYDPMRFPAPNNLISVARTTDGLVVADSNRLYISLAGEPMFTFDGVVEIEDKILMIKAINTTILVFTDGMPVKVAYQIGELMSLDKQVINRKIPLASRASVSFYNGRVFFASTYSLYVWDLGKYGADITSPVKIAFTPEQWKNMDPYSVAGTAYELGYIFSSAAMDYSIMLEFGGDGFDTISENSIMPISFINGTIFGTNNRGDIIYQENDTIVHVWDWRRDVCQSFDINDHVRPTVCENCNCCPWSLKLYFDNERKNNFSHMRVEWDERSAESIEVSFHIHEFGREIDTPKTYEIINSRAFGVPFRNVSYQSIYAQLKGCAILHEVRFGTSAQETTHNSNAQVEG